MSRPAALLLLLVLAIGLAGCSLDEEAPPSPGEGGTELGTSGDDGDALAKLGLPAIASKNTTRVGGGDSVADAAGVANAVFPATSDTTRPNAVVLVDRDDWAGGVSAAQLTAEPIGAAMLLSDGDALPAVTEDALTRLNPRGSELARGAQVIRIGDEPPSPEGRVGAVIRGPNQYERAAAIDRFFSAAKGEPSGNVIVASGERPEFAMPAAAWAGRSGDPVLLTARNELPDATANAIRQHQKPNIFVLGPESVIGPGVEQELRQLGRVRRVEGPTPVENAIEFARYKNENFGWGIVVPGFNFVLANVTRPLDAAAAAPLGSNGVFAPLLLTDSADRLPPALEGYFLDVQPGFEQDPGRGVYNRVWLLGDDGTVSRQVQGRLDQISQLIPVDAPSPAEREGPPPRDRPPPGGPPGGGRRDAG